MLRKIRTVSFLILPVLFAAGCASDYEVALGSSVSMIKSEQTMNPEASEENLGYVPAGSGERMQATLDVYHKQTASMKSDTSMSAQNVLAIPVSSSSSK
ncbi:hypothetical protein [Vibrio hannami]|uniref:hypothetical protein n=1 Tax=Vibrio hannami TaxID=2717094 RepID=UPI003BAEC7B4